MHRLVTPRRVRASDERGAVAIMVALSMTAILVLAAMVLDFGLIRIDRQVDRSAADAATLAGLHGLNTGDGTPHPFVGVCTAVRYLQANSSRFAGVSTGSGWTDGLGAAKADGCTDTTLRNTTCRPGDKSSWAKWHWEGTSNGIDLDVTVESGYDFAATGNQWQEDSLAATSGDNGATEYAGCDNLAVTILQSREPGLGSLATSSDLSTGIRSVGRIKPMPGDSAPAMLLLKRTGCPVLKTGASGGTSFIHVEGAVAPNGKTQPGTIHSDSDGGGCTGGNDANRLFSGLAGGGIVAYAAPLSLANPTAADPAKPGSITSVAAANGVGAAIVRDALDNVYGSSSRNGTGGTKGEVTGRGLVTRRLVDERYFDGVKPAMAGASTVFSTGAAATPAGWTPLSASNVCKPTQAEVNTSVATANLATSGRLYIGCTGPNGFEGTGPTLEINASQVYFKGMVAPASNVALSLPLAKKVYVGNHASKPEGIKISNNTSFSVNNDPVNLDSSTGYCRTGQSANKAVLFVNYGQFKQTGGLLRMCRTTVMMLGGSTTGCVPGTPGTAPNLLTPCGGTLGNGQFTQNGGGIDWTAPDTMDAVTDAAGNQLPTAVTAWHDVNGPEDLSLWSESGTNSSTNFSMAGGGLFRVRGVFMTPNAGPFIISGGASLDLTNAQYIATSVELNGNTTSITMRVDPNSAVTLPDQGLVGLVR